MLSCYGIRHCKLVIAIMLNEWVEAACLHFSLQNNFTVGKVFCIYFHNPDMLSVYWCVEQVQVVMVKDKIPP